MPADDGLRLHEQQWQAPARPDPREQRPEPSIVVAEPRPRPAALVDRELLTQGQVLENELGLRPERASEAADEQHEIQHRARLHGCR